MKKKMKKKKKWKSNLSEWERCVDMFGGIIVSGAWALRGLALCFFNNNQPHLSLLLFFYIFSPRPSARPRGMLRPAGKIILALFIAYQLAIHISFRRRDVAGDGIVDVHRAGLGTG
jgi:hypothetical protein